MINMVDSHEAEDYAAVYPTYSVRTPMLIVKIKLKFTKIYLYSCLETNLIFFIIIIIIICL